MRSYSCPTFLNIKIWNVIEDYAPCPTSPSPTHSPFSIYRTSSPIPLPLPIPTPTPSSFQLPSHSLSQSSNSATPPAFPQSAQGLTRDPTRMEHCSLYACLLNIIQNFIKHKTFFLFWISSSWLLLSSSEEQNQPTSWVRSLERHEFRRHKNENYSKTFMNFL